jgi:hypothetical protein
VSFAQLQQVSVDGIRNSFEMRIHGYSLFT